MATVENGQQNGQHDTNGYDQFIEDQEKGDDGTQGDDPGSPRYQK